MSGSNLGNDDDKPLTILMDKSVGRYYPIRVKVKETDWGSAVRSCPVYLAVGKDEKAWMWLSRGQLQEIVETLQEALALAKDPVSSDA